MNPLIPSGSDVLWALLFVLHVALVTVALVTLAKSARKQLRLLLALVVVLVPLVGPVAYLVAERSSRAYLAQQRIRDSATAR